MSQQSEDDAVYNLMVDDATGDLQPKVDKVFFLIFFLHEVPFNSFRFFLDS